MPAVKYVPKYVVAPWSSLREHGCVLIPDSKDLEGSLKRIAEDLQGQPAGKTSHISWETLSGALDVEEPVIVDYCLDPCCEIKDTTVEVCRDGNIRIQWDELGDTAVTPYFNYAEFRKTTPRYQCDENGEPNISREAIAGLFSLQTLVPRDAKYSEFSTRSTGIGAKLLIPMNPALSRKINGVVASLQILPSEIQGLSIACPDTLWTDAEGEILPTLLTKIDVNRSGFLYFSSQSHDGQSLRLKSCVAEYDSLLEADRDCHVTYAEFVEQLSQGPRP